MRTIRGRLSSERGSIAVMVAVSLFMMLALAALAIDLSYLRDSKAEAQRAADVIALSGASAFRDLPFADSKTVDSAWNRALEVARNNKVRADTLDVRSPQTTTTTYAWGKVTVVQTNDVTLNVIPDSQKVRAWVRRVGIATFFGGLLAKPYAHVQAMATAWATNAGPVVNCMKPFVLPDMWYESDKTTQDKNGNDYMEPNSTGVGNTTTGESWKYQPAAIGGSDYYVPFDPSVPDDPLHPQTGYGSAIRSKDGYPGDVGLPMLIAPQTGNGNGKPAERMGNSYWILDEDPDSNTRAEITTGCINATIGGTPKYDVGSRTGQVNQGINDLVSQDPNATWNQTTKQVEGSKFPDWTSSPRVITICLVDPKYWMANSVNTKPDPGSVFSNFARMFLLPSPKSPPDNIQAIFLGPAPGGAGGPTGGTLVKVLQLIQ
jgi:Flp pilus assembly protein TadG